MDEQKGVFTIEGNVEVVDNEGVYPQFMVGESDLADLVAKHFALPWLEKKANWDKTLVLGKTRITIERL